MILTNDYIKQVVADYFKDKPVTKVYLFGSYANGSANEDSDIDLLFSLNKDCKIGYFKLAGYLIELENKLKKKVDLIEEGFVFKTFIPSIEKDKILIVER